jgi:hypothetical protein
MIAEVAEGVGVPAASVDAGAANRAIVERHDSDYESGAEMNASSDSDCEAAVNDDDDAAAESDYGVASELSDDQLSENYLDDDISPSEGEELEEAITRPAKRKTSANGPKEESQRALLQKQVGKSTETAKRARRAHITDVNQQMSRTVEERRSTRRASLHRTAQRVDDANGRRAPKHEHSKEADQHRRRMVSQLLKPFGRKRPTWQKALPRKRSCKQKKEVVVPATQRPFAAFSEHFQKRAPKHSASKQKAAGAFSRKMRTGLLKRRRLAEESSDSESPRAVLDCIPSPELLQIARSMDASIEAEVD